MDLIEHVESKLVNIVTTQMKRYWEITFNRWQEIARRVHNQLDTLDDAKAALQKDIPGFDIDTREVAEVRAIFPWLSATVDQRAEIKEDEVDAIRRGPSGVASLKKATLKRYTERWEPVSDVGLFKSDPLVKVVGDLLPPRLREHPCLRMMYRHLTSWRKSGYRSKAVVAGVYALRCVLDYRFQIATTGRLQSMECGSLLRTSLFDFLSTICQPTLDNYIEARGPVSATVNSKYVCWNDLILDDMKTAALKTVEAQQAEREGAGKPQDVEIVAAPAARLASTDRIKKYEGEIKAIVRAVVKASCSSAAPLNSKGTDKNVAHALIMLVEVCRSPSSLRRLCAHIHTVPKDEC